MGVSSKSVVFVSLEEEEMGEGSAMSVLGLVASGEAILGGWRWLKLPVDLNSQLNQ